MTNKCEYIATHKGNLAYHIQSVYERAKYQCIQCHYGDSCKDTLTRHIKSTHQVVKSDHILVYTNEKDTSLFFLCKRLFLSEKTIFQVLTGLFLSVF